MSRAGLVGAIAMLMAACAPAPTPPAPTASPPATPKADTLHACSVLSARTVAFTAPDAQNRLEAHAFGPSCQGATVVVTLRDAQGHALWAQAEPYTQLATYDPSMPPATPEILQQFLDTMLVSARMVRTAEAPEWTPDRPSLALEEGVLDETRLPREFYLQLRVKNLPMLCVPMGQHAQSCLFFDPASDGVGELYSSAS